MDATSPPTVTGTVRVLQIITLAMIFGVTVFLGIGWFQPQAPNANANPQAGISLLLAIGIVMAVSGILFSTVVVPLITRAQVSALANQHSGGTQAADSAAKGTETESLDTRLLGIHQVAHILRLAVLEGPAFFLGFVFMNEHSPIALGLALGLLAVMAAHFPTTLRVERWLENQRQGIGPSRSSS